VLNLFFHTSELVLVLLYYERVEKVKDVLTETFYGYLIVRMKLKFNPFNKNKENEVFNVVFCVNTEILRTLPTNYM
jgi:hypothetical protein